MKTAKYLAAAERTAAKIEAYKQAKAIERQAWEKYCATSVQEWQEHRAAYEAWRAADKKKNIIGGFVKQMVSRLRSLRFSKEEKPIYIKRDYISPECAISDYKFLASL